MFGFLIYCLLWKIAFAAEYPVCIGVHSDVQHFDTESDTQTAVFNNSIDIYINPYKSDSIYNEVTFSNYNYSSINETFYYINSTTFCPFLGPNLISCFEWNPLKNATITHKVPFDTWRLIYIVRIGYSKFESGATDLIYDNGIIFTTEDNAFFPAKDDSGIDRNCTKTASYDDNMKLQWNTEKLHRTHPSCKRTFETYFTMSIESVITAIFTDDSQYDDSVIESSNVEAPDLREPGVESLPMEEADPTPNVQQPLPGLMKYGAACSNSNISVIIFGPSAIKFELHTLETIALPMNNQYF